MPRKKGTKHIQIYMAEEAIEAVTEHAKSIGHGFMADYVRALIQEDMAKHGKTVEFGIERGGWRGGPKEIDDQ